MDLLLSRTVLLHPSYDHLAELTDGRGIFEHALYAVPRKDHGYCVDDVARALIVAVSATEQSPLIAECTRTYLGFLEEAIAEDGQVRNRMTAFGQWSDEPRPGDWWGRLLWALGIAAARARTTELRERASSAFHRAAAARAPQMRAMAFAMLGAAELLAAHPGDRTARALLADGIAAIPLGTDASWPWPEPRLRYGNASIAEALIAAGHALQEPEVLERGMLLLGFLLERESGSGHLSVTGTGGRGPGESGPSFDQQPIEVAALADACARAYELNGQTRWLLGVQDAWAWFSGANDSGVAMYDIERGAGFDGLEPGGRNENQGAESTLAALRTHQQARRLAFAENAEASR